MNLNVYEPIMMSSSSLSLSLRDRAEPLEWEYSQRHEAWIRGDSPVLGFDYVAPTSDPLTYPSPDFFRDLSDPKAPAPQERDSLTRHTHTPSRASSAISLSTTDTEVYDDDDSNAAYLYTRAFSASSRQATSVLTPSSTRTVLPSRPLPSISIIRLGMSTAASSSAVTHASTPSPFDDQGKHIRYDLNSSEDIEHERMVQKSSELLESTAPSISISSSSSSHSFAESKLGPRLALRSGGSGGGRSTRWSQKTTDIGTATTSEEHERHALRAKKSKVPLADPGLGLSQRSGGSGGGRSTRWSQKTAQDIGNSMATNGSLSSLSPSESTTVGVSSGNNGGGTSRSTRYGGRGIYTTASKERKDEKEKNTRRLRIAGLGAHFGFRSRPMNTLPSSSTPSLTSTSQASHQPTSPSHITVQRAGRTIIFPPPPRELPPLPPNDSTNIRGVKSKLGLKDRKMEEDDEYIIARGGGLDDRGKVITIPVERGAEPEETELAYLRPSSTYSARLIDAVNSVTSGGGHRQA